MVTAKVWILDTKCYGLPQLENFKCIEEQLPPCKNGDVIVEAEFLSVDPYIRMLLRYAEVDTVVPGSQVARVIESRNESFPVGSYVVGCPGWRTHSHLTRRQLSTPDSFLKFPFLKLTDFGAIRRSAALGALGMPGNTAYFAFTEFAKPQKGETVLVNAAAGAVGSLLCQIAKLTGCRVIAFAGSDEKVVWLKELGVDYAFNYKTSDVSKVLKESAPNGVDCYFEQVGGDFAKQVVPHLATKGRVTIIGQIATYNDETEGLEGAPSDPSPYDAMDILVKELRVEGMVVASFARRWHEGIERMKRWVEEGKIQIKETITEGFENTPKAFLGLFKGDNLGKAIVQL